MAAWQRLFGIDTRALAALRIGIALLVLVDLVIRSTDLSAHYSDDGILPRAARITAFDLQDASATRLAWSLHLLNGTVWYQAGLFLVAALFAVWLLVGYRTRLATVVSWVLLASLQMRLPMVLQGGDTLLRMLLFWSMFLPLGAAWSLDRRLASLRGAAQAHEPRVVASTATAALLLQVAAMYLFNAMAKYDPVWYPRYEAAYYALHFDLYVTPLGRELLAYPRLLSTLTMATWWLEWLGPLVAFLPIGTHAWRLGLVAVFWSFHVGLALCLTLGLLPYVALVAWLPFLPSSVWCRIEARLAPLAGRLRDRSVERWFRHPEPPQWRLGRAASAAVCVLFAYVVLLGTATSLDIPLAHPWYPAAEVLRLQQEWRMFAPRPTTADGWFVVRGELADGREVNLWQPGEPLPWERPAVVSAAFPNHRWRKYWTGFCENGDQELLSCLSDWLRWRWDTMYADDSPQRALRLVEIYFLPDPTMPPDVAADRPREEAAPRERRLIWSWDYLRGTPSAAPVPAP